MLEISGKGVYTKNVKGQDGFLRVFDLIVSLTDTGDIILYSNF